MKPHVLLIFNTRFEESAAMLRGIAHYQRCHRPWMISLDDVARAESAMVWAQSPQWNGVISRHTTAAVVETCARLNLPLVDLDDSAPVPGVTKIRPDNVAIGHLGAEYFLERRFRHFGFFGYSDVSWAQERQSGYLESLLLAGRGSTVLETAFVSEVTPSWDAQQQVMLTEWLVRLPKGSAVMACNDHCALRVVRAANAAGIDVPEDLAVLGADNDALHCELSDPPVSSIAINGFQAGCQAAEHLDRMMAGEKPAVADLRLEPVGVVTRKSTDILALRDKDVSVALEFIQKNACQGITVDQVLGRVFVSRSQLEHKFRRYIGRSPQAEIRRVQIAHISQLLVETDLPLKEISERAGFIHVEYMSVVFKRVMGETPGRFRKNTQSHELVRALA